MGERICVLKDGVIQQVDTPTALYDRPANAFVASFIGSPEMNIHPAALQTQGNELAVLLGGQFLPLPEVKAQRMRLRTGAIKFGLRPEHISAETRPQGDSFAVPGTLRFSEHMGSEVFVHFDIGSMPMTARVPSDQLGSLAGKTRGAAHTFHLQLGCSHLFDGAEDGSGANLLL